MDSDRLKKVPYELNEVYEPVVWSLNRECFTCWQRSLAFKKWICEEFYLEAQVNHENETSRDFVFLNALLKPGRDAGNGNA